MVHRKRSSFANVPWYGLGKQMHGNNVKPESSNVNRLHNHFYPESVVRSGRFGLSPTRRSDVLQICTAKRCADLPGCCDLKTPEWGPRIIGRQNPEGANSFQLYENHVLDRNCFKSNTSKKNLLRAQLHTVLAGTESNPIYKPNTIKPTQVTCWSTLLQESPEAGTARGCQA